MKIFDLFPESSKTWQKSGNQKNFTGNSAKRRWRDDRFRMGVARRARKDAKEERKETFGGAEGVKWAKWQKPKKEELEGQ